MSEQFNLGLTDKGHPATNVGNHLLGQGWFTCVKIQVGEARFVGANASWTKTGKLFLLKDDPIAEDLGRHFQRKSLFPVARRKLTDLQGTSYRSYVTRLRIVGVTNLDAISFEEPSPGFRFDFVFDAHEMGDPPPSAARGKTVSGVISSAFFKALQERNKR